MKTNSNNLLVAKLYTGYIASLAENGCISVPERYACDYRKQGVRGRVPRFIEENNGYAESVICDHERIYVGDPHGKRFLLFFCCRGAVPREVFDLVGKDPDSHHRQIALRQCHPCGHEYWRYGVYGACPPIISPIAVSCGSSIIAIKTDRLNNIYCGRTRRDRPDDLFLGCKTNPGTRPCRSVDNMDKLVRKIEVPLAKSAVKKEGLYLVPKERLGELADVAMDAYQDYPLHNWLSGGTYDPKASRIIMDISLKTMMEDAVIYADSEELNGFAVWLPLGFTGSKTLPFLMNGGIGLILHSGPGIIGRLLTYETFAMKLKKTYTDHKDWYLYNLCVSRKAQGKGIASKLLRPMLEFCDNEKMVSYLETNKESNVTLYQHYGFQLAEQKLVPKSNVMHYAMTRKPMPVE